MQNLLSLPYNKLWVPGLKIIKNRDDKFYEGSSSLRQYKRVIDSSLRTYADLRRKNKEKALEALKLKNTERAKFFGNNLLTIDMQIKVLQDYGLLLDYVLLNLQYSHTTGKLYDQLGGAVKTLNKNTIGEKQFEQLQTSVNRISDMSDTIFHRMEEQMQVFSGTIKDISDRSPASVEKLTEAENAIAEGSGNETKSSVEDEQLDALLKELEKDSK